MGNIWRRKWTCPQDRFYTSTWIPNVNDQTRYYLFPTEKGPSIFQSLKGSFTATGLSFLAVIVEGNYAVSLKVSYRNPSSMTSVSLPLYIPIPFASYCDELIMTQELFQIDTLSVLTKPVPKYLASALKRIQYLEDTSIDLTFNSTISLQTNYSATTLPSRTYLNVSTRSGGLDIGVTCYTPTDPTHLKTNIVRLFPSYITFIAKTIPGANVITTADIDLTILLRNKKDATGRKIVVQSTNFLYGSINSFGYLDNYNIRGKPCSFRVPAFIYTSGPQNSVYTYNYKASTILPANVEIVGLRGYLKTPAANQIITTPADLEVEILINSLVLSFQQI